MKRFLFVLAGLIILVLGCSKEKVNPSIDTNISTEELPDQESWNSTVFFSDSGKTKAILWTGHLRVFGKTNTTLLDSNIKVDFYNDDQVKTSTLTAKRGKVDENTNNLYAIDSVVAVNDSGVVIRTDEMMWRNKDRKIVSDKYVTIVSPKEKIEGYGFESDQNLRNYVIYDITYITNADSVK